MPERDPHRASYDADGNILLPGAHARELPADTWVSVESGKTLQEEVLPWNPESQVAPWTPPVIVPERRPREILAFSPDADDLPPVTDEPEDADILESAESHFTEERVVRPPLGERAIHWEVIEENAPVAQVWRELRGQFASVTNDLLHEGVRQYASLAVDGNMARRGMAESAIESLKNLKTFLLQPVWVPGRKKTVKQHSRATLFVLDVVRFGGTFAVIFAGLFLALNYESFWTIAKANLDPIAELRPAQLQANVQKNLEALGHAPTLAEQSDLAGMVPPVGPPKNTLIIPALDLNVPIQTPSTASLIREDWGTLEEEIQGALMNGVVHYPGTAKPGQAGNFFVTGHSSYFPWVQSAYKSVFARLSALNPGDEYWVFYNGDKHRYVIQEKKEVLPSDVTVLDQPIGKRISTLMTCTPVGTTLRRLVLIAQEVDPLTGQVLEVGEHSTAEALPAAKVEMLPI
jgi:LPXTG-site transpeptidase (sortase) family protein